MIIGLHTIAPKYYKAIQARFPCLYLLRDSIVKLVTYFFEIFLKFPGQSGRWIERIRKTYSSRAISPLSWRIFLKALYSVLITPR